MNSLNLIPQPGDLSDLTVPPFLIELPHFLNAYWVVKQS